VAEMKCNKKMFKFDKTYYREKVDLLGGIDEAGRGPLAGPVAAACVILPKGYELDGLNDSKKLTANQREKLEPEIKKAAIDWSVAFCPPQLIDRINILEATKMAMIISYQLLKIKPQLLLIDALKINYFSVEHYGIIKGDATSAAIAAASILAKQARDKYMVNLHELYPVYGFSKNKGYPTRCHYECLNIHGPCDEHRFSFRGVS